MENKKHPGKNLEQHRFLFFQIGLIASLIVVIVIMSWTKTSTGDILNRTAGEEYVEEQIDIMSTFRQEKKKVLAVQQPAPDPSPEPIPEPNPPTPDPVIPIPGVDPFIEPGGDPWGEPLEPELPVNILLCEKGPVFPGCEGIADKDDLKACFNEQIMKYVSAHVNYPVYAKEYGIQGKVYVNFIIEKNGTISQVNVVRSVDKHLDAEAIRVIRSIPRMEPAKQRGKAVRMTMTMPINFVLN